MPGAYRGCRPVVAYGRPSRRGRRNLSRSRNRPRLPRSACRAARATTAAAIAALAAAPALADDARPTLDERFTDNSGELLADVPEDESDWLDRLCCTKGM